MYVVADVEWAFNKSEKRSPTQLTAVRVDAEWNVVEKFTEYIKPADSSFHEWSQVAYNGGMPEAFLYARSCFAVMKAFEKWLKANDVLCWWFEESKRMFNETYSMMLKKEHGLRTVILSDYMVDFFKWKGRQIVSPYILARDRNIDVPDLTHDSENDVTAILNLFKGVGFPQELLARSPKIPPPPPLKISSIKNPYYYDVQSRLFHKKGCTLLSEQTKGFGFDSVSSGIKKNFRPCECAKKDYRQFYQARAKKLLSRLSYNYAYSPTSNVFHRVSCKHLYNAHNISGSTKYETVVKTGRRPCKVCNPDPLCDLNEKQRYVNRALSGSEQRALVRHKESQKERFSVASNKILTEQERKDFLTLTQPNLVFFASCGCQNFHTMNCSKLKGKTEIRGFGSFADARRAGYTPCRSCRPSKKLDVKVSIPITSKVRQTETLSELKRLCASWGYSYSLDNKFFKIETMVGKWKIYIFSRPVVVDHVNLVVTPNSDEYHRQHRIFLSLVDAFNYIHRHDDSLLQKRLCKTKTSLACYP